MVITLFIWRTFQIRCFLLNNTDSLDIENDQRRLEHIEALTGVLKDLLTIDLLPSSSDLLAMYGRVGSDQIAIILIFTDSSFFFFLLDDRECFQYPGPRNEFNWDRHLSWCIRNGSQL